MLNECVIQDDNLDILEDQINDDHENHLLSLMVSSLEWYGQVQVALT